MKLFNNDKGFTLIEMLAVLVILGIVFGFVVSKTISFDGNANKTTEVYMEKAVERKDFYNDLLKKD